MARYDACVIGGGPAGAATALRLAKFGYSICVIERCRFPRPHVGESLTRGTCLILDALGLRDTVLDQESVEPDETLVRWTTGYTERLAGRQRSAVGLLVDRAAFDAVLLRSAREAGVRVFQPGQVRGINRRHDGWHIELATGGATHKLAATFVVDATGRKGFLRPKRRCLAPRTMALCGHLNLRHPARASLVEAISDGWCWGAPIPGGLFSAMIFLDPQSLRGTRRAGLESIWRSYLARTELFADLARAPAAGPIVACDASAYGDEHPVSPGLVRVGEANFALDPLSSTGLEKAMQTGLLAALALHTTMRRPERAALCERFYRDRSQEAVVAHQQWSSHFYADVERFRHHPFWRTRSAEPKLPSQQMPPPVALETDALSLRTRVRVSQQARLAEEPCIVDDEIQLQAALFHPALERPVAFLDGARIEDLLRSVPSAVDLAGVLTLWCGRMPLSQARRAAAWMLKNHILEPVA
jgi:flavin-dependent dehydrogenase